MVKKTEFNKFYGEEDVKVTPNFSKVYLINKRTMDLLGATAGIVILSILFIIIAVLIKMEDPKGPVFFSQKRVGKNGKEFNMYKFRSMVVDAEERLGSLLKYNETTGAMFKMKEDPRITRIGKFIRKTSIDELPQLINVIRGDMSLVGPRPPLPREVESYNKKHLKRLIVTPGCTGLWQISGRSNIGFEEMVNLDLKYINEQSLLIDISIVIKTCKTLLESKGAF
ncbi:multidrug MFS transporter [Priestia aryabhattai]|nr:multidrug MFS transporter [Priestia aryabhattai]KMO01800.1 multidrug MFS transporter [Priestia aryabhattai]